MLQIVCLQAKAVPNKPGRVSPRRLAEVSGLSVTKTGEELWLAEMPGCSCTLLSDNADFSAEFWELRSELLENLVSAFRLLAKEASGFSFEAFWAGDNVESESRTSLREFIKDVRANRIRNGHRYFVGRA